MFTVSDQSAWDKWLATNTDRDGKVVMDYAAAWANLMEAAISNGETLENCADRTSYEADTDGITNFMQSAAVKVLSSCWIHGEQLRQWYNLDTLLLK